MAEDYQDSSCLVRFTEIEAETDLIETYEIDSDYLTPTDGFSFTLYDDDVSKIRGLEMQPVEILIDGASQLIGRIDKTTISSKAVTCDGRDYIADITECNVDPTLKLTADMTLADALTLGLGPVGIDTIVSDEDFSLRDVRSGKRFGGSVTKKAVKNGKIEDYKPNPGEGLYEFYNRLVARYGVTMQPGSARNELFITAPNYELDAAYSLVVADGDAALGSSNNVISATAVRDYSKFPTWTLFNGWKTKSSTERDAEGNEQRVFQRNPIKAESDIVQFTTEIGGELSATIGKQVYQGRVKPGEVKPGSALYRLLTYRDDNSRNADQLLAAATRSVAERIKDTLIYTCTLKGHKDPQTGALWAVDTIVDVNDEIRDVHEPMWVAKRTFKYSRGAGATTDLTLWRKGVFVI